jgi:polyhydroxybutyrate depolymerase
MALAPLLAACGPRVLPVIGGALEAAGPTSAPGARPSPGCAEGVDADRALPSGLSVVGRERTFLARVPDGASRAPRDLVIAFHGRTNDAAQVRRYFGLDEALPESIVVYPRALAAGPGAFAWSDPGDPPDRPRDLAFVGALVDAVGQARCVDLDRVFVVGHSLGAYFANDVACRLGDRIRAVASVAGGVQGEGCVGGAAALLVHHPDDGLVRIGEGAAARDAFRDSNGLATAPGVPVADGPLARLRCARHGDAAAADPVVWCPRDDATTPRGRDPHTWPSGTAEAIGAFFAGLP